MTPARLSPRARTDIEAIWDYTESRWGIPQALRYVRLIQAAVEAIADNPSLGGTCDDIRKGYRRHRAGSHVIFYRVRDGVEIVRILHQRMDHGRHL